MIVGIPKRSLFALPRVAFRRVGRIEPLVAPRPRLGLFSAFAMMMERQADLFIRGLGE